MDMGRGFSRITDVFDEARRLDEMVAAMGGDAPAHVESARTEDVPPDPLAAAKGLASEAGVVVGVDWLLAFLKRLETRVAALEAEFAPPLRTRKCRRCSSVPPSASDHPAAGVVPPHPSSRRPS